MREAFIDVICLTLAKFRFKHFSPIRAEEDVKAISGIWVDELMREQVTAKEAATALDWLMANKPEFPDIADVLKRVRKYRKQRDDLLRMDAKGIEVGDGVIRIVAKDSPEALALDERVLALPADIEASKDVLRRKLSELSLKVVEPLKTKYTTREKVDDIEGEEEVRARILAQLEELK